MYVSNLLIVVCQRSEYLYADLRACYDYGLVKSEVWGPEVSASLVTWQEQDEGSLGPSQRSSSVCTTQRSEQGTPFIRD